MVINRLCFKFFDSVPDLYYLLVFYRRFQEIPEKKLNTIYVLYSKIYRFSRTIYRYLKTYIFKWPQKCQRVHAKVPGSIPASADTEVLKTAYNKDQTCSTYN